MIASPYRQNARSHSPPSWPGLSHVALAAVVACCALGSFVWWKFHTRASSRHAVLAAISERMWFNDVDTRGVAVGEAGAVWIRRGDATAPWESVATGTHETLLAVSGGEGPQMRQSTLVIEPTFQRVFAVGTKGTLLQCGDDACAVVPTHVNEDLRAVAVADGLAYAVGTHGRIIEVGATDSVDGMAVKASPVETEIHDDLNAVLIRCGHSDPRCLVVAVGENGAIVEGASQPRCAQRPLSLRTQDCQWTWKRLAPPPALASASLTHVTYARGKVRVQARDGRSDVLP